MTWLKKHPIIKSWLIGAIVLFLAGVALGLLLDNEGLAYLFGEFIGFWAFICIVRGTLRVFRKSGVRDN